MLIDRRLIGRTALLLAIVIALAAPSWAQVKLNKGTEIKVAFKQDVSSKYVKPGDEVPIVLKEDIVVGGVTLVRAGVGGKATVKSVKSAGKVGKGGKLTVDLSELTADGSGLNTIDNENIMIEAANGPLEVKGSGRTIISILFIAGLLIKGGEAVIPADTEVLARVTKDIFIIPVGS